jgi:hypothetical protein
MILNTGMRTDIPAFYSKWFHNRIQAGFVRVRNPYNPLQVTEYRLDPKVIDLLVFGTKNPAPILPYLEELAKFRTYWMVTINPYGKEVECNVPDWHQLQKSMKVLSERLGKKALTWRYCPVIVNDRYPAEWHIQRFEEMASVFSRYTDTCMMGFLDLYEKTKRNYPEGRIIGVHEKARIAQAFAETASRYGMRIIGCVEDRSLGEYGVDVSGCMTHHALEQIGDFRLKIPKSEQTAFKRNGSSSDLTDAQMKDARLFHGCILGHDIGAYNTCLHGCKYCYANTDTRAVQYNAKRHDPDSPYLTGGSLGGEVIHQAKQKSWIIHEEQLSLF